MSTELLRNKTGWLEDDWLTASSHCVEIDKHLEAAEMCQLAWDGLVHSLGKDGVVDHLGHGLQVGKGGRGAGAVGIRREILSDGGGAICRKKERKKNMEKFETKM